MPGPTHILRHGRDGGINFGGYCPYTCKVIEPLKRVLLWAFAKNGGAHCVMAIPTMQRLLKENHGVSACTRTVCYALKRLQLGGFISRQSRWRKCADGAIERVRSVTRPKGKLMREQLDRGLRGLKLLALTWQPGGEGVVQKIAHGYYSLLKDVVPEGSIERR